MARTKPPNTPSKAMATPRFTNASLIRCDISRSSFWKWAWLEYFERAYIYGVDMVRDTNPWNVPGEGNWYGDFAARYIFSHGNQTDRTGWKCFLANYGSEWDVVIDDGGHY